MFYDLEGAQSGLGYRLLASTVTPRPIAWITTRSAKGAVNAAPFSFFNAMGGAPPTLAVGFLAGADGWKDTPRNIRETGEFVVHLVSHAMVEAMNLTSVDAPTEISELDLAGLDTSAARKVGAPLITGAPVAFECRCLSFVETGAYQGVAIGQVLAAHVADAVLTDHGRGHVDTPAMDLVSRLHGRGFYGRTDRVFELLRPSWPLEPLDL